MEFISGINIVRFAAGLITLLIGCWMDLKTRKVRNRLWLISGGVAGLLLVMAVADLSRSAFAVVLTVVPIYYFYYFYSDLDPERMPRGSEWAWALMGLAVIGLYAGAVFHYNIPRMVSLMLLITFILLSINEVMLLRYGRSNRLSWMVLIILSFVSLVLLTQYDGASINAEVPFAAASDPIHPSFMLITSVLLIITVIYSMYNSGIIMGGADAKALMLISLMVPAYPVVGHLSFSTYFFEILDTVPLQRFLLPFSLASLLNGAILLLVYPLFFLVLNLVRRDFRFPRCFFGYRLNIDLFEKRFVWLLEIERDGRRKMALSPPRDEKKVKEQLDIFRKAGDEKIWVQPKIPFVIPMTAGYVISILFGNLVFLFLGLFI